MTKGAVRKTSRFSALLLLIPILTMLNVAPSYAVALNPPTNVVPTAVSSTSIRVTFIATNNGTPASYTVFVYDSANGYAEPPIRTQTNIATSPVVIADLETNKTYKVRMQAIAATGDTDSARTALSSRSATLGAALATPSAPTVTATANTLKSIGVSWSAITNATSYTLKLYDSSNTPLATLTGFTGTSTTITAANYSSIADNTLYKVSITAIGNGSTITNSAESPLASVTTNAAPVAPAISVQPTNQSSTFASTATFSVSATSSDSGTLGYQWQVSTDSGANWSNVSSGTGGTTSSYTTASLVMANNGYQYRARITNTKNGATSAAVISSPATLTVAKANQSALLPPELSATSATYNGSAYSQALTVTSGGGGSGTGTLSITGVADGSATGCSFSAGTLSASTSGTCTLTVTKAGDSNYNAVSTTATFTFNKANQSTLSFDLSATSAAGIGTSFSKVLTMTPSGGSGDGATTYAIVSGGSASGCALANDSASNTISATSVGTCLIQATKAANSNYNSITSSTVTFTFTRAISTDNTLGSLTVTPGTTTPVLFSSATNSYSVSISSTVTSLTITAAPSSQYATMTLNGSTIASNTSTTFTSDPNLTSEVITIAVTAENGSIQNYLITVKKVVILKTSEVLAPNVSPTPSPVKSTTQFIETPSDVPQINSMLYVATGLAATSGPVGTSVIINGSGFNSVLSVRMNGLRITPTSVTPTAITLNIPSGARTGPIVISTSKGSVSTPRFTVTVSP